MNAEQREKILGAACEVCHWPVVLNARELEDFCDRCPVERAVDAVEALSKMEKTTRWIPVTERLPKENGRYLVRYVRDIDGVHSDEVRIMWFADAQWRFPFICNPDVRELVTMEKVTHWMSLPEPPKEEA